MFQLVAFIRVIIIIISNRIRNQYYVSGTALAARFKVSCLVFGSRQRKEVKETWWIVSAMKRIPGD